VSLPILIDNSSDEVVVLSSSLDTSPSGDEREETPAPSHTQDAAVEEVTSQNPDATVEEGTSRDPEEPVSIHRDVIDTRKGVTNITCDFSSPLYTLPEEDDIVTSPCILALSSLTTSGHQNLGLQASLQLAASGGTGPAGHTDPSWPAELSSLAAAGRETARKEEPAREEENAVETHVQENVTSLSVGWGDEPSCFSLAVDTDGPSG
jgi:hypothetical protein